jgi:hypothetical protein
MSEEYLHIPRIRSQKADNPTRIRQEQNSRVQNIEQEPMKYIALALIHLRNELAKLPRMIEDQSRPVDEYVAQEVLPATVTTPLLILPQWEVSEKITSIIIVGPPGNVTLQLGDRIWPLTIPAAGFIIMSPVAVLLSRSDLRQLTFGAPGIYMVELMGYCDTRNELV